MSLEGDLRDDEGVGRAWSEIGRMQRGRDGLEEEEVGIGLKDEQKGGNRDQLRLQHTRRKRDG